MIVEIRTDDFELQENGKSSGRFMRGEVEGGVINGLETVDVTLFLDGQTYSVKTSDLAIIEEN